MTWLVGILLFLLGLGSGLALSHLHSFKFAFKLGIADIFNWVIVVGLARLLQIYWQRNYSDVRVEKDLLIQQAKDAAVALKEARSRFSECCDRRKITRDDARLTKVALRNLANSLYSLESALRQCDRILGPAEEINGLGRCPTYLYRWTLLKLRGRFSVYLHHFVGDDWSRDLHDHPKRFISIGLRGWYCEETPIFPMTYRTELWTSGLGEANTFISRRIYRAPWIRTFPPTHIHRIVVPSKDCWTLVIVLKPVREWGFWPHGRWVNWRAYVQSKDADSAKGCE